MSETRDFHLGDVLTITTGRLVAHEGMPAVYLILNWMTGESVYTHQIPRVMKEAAPVLLAMHPQLAAVDENAEINPGNLDQWLATQVALFGEYLPVPKLTADQHERIDALSELAERFPPEKIIVVRS